MAKFIYRMQNILNIKYKLEESAKQEYAEARQALAAEEQKLDALKKRKQGYYEAYQASIQGRLDFLEIEERYDYRGAECSDPAEEQRTGTCQTEDGTRDAGTENA